LSLEKLYLFLVIVLTGTVYAALVSSVILAISVVVLILLFLKDVNAKYNINLLFTYFALTLLLAGIFLCHFIIVPLGNDLVPYAGLYLRFTLAGLFFVYLKNKQTDFSYLLQSVLKWIAIHATLGFILSSFLIDYVLSVNSENFHSNTFLYLFFYNSHFSLLGINIYRNQGIFWEPGILQIYMNILFFISSFLIRNRKLQILAAILILTTYSTTGIGILLIQFLVILFSGNATFIQKTALLLMLLTVAIPIFILNYNAKVNNDDDSTDQTSSAFRIYDMVEGFNISRQYPLTGIGLSEDTYKAVKSANNSFFTNYSQDFTNILLDRRSSNSVMFFLTRFGIPFTLGYFIVLYRQKLFEKKKWLIFLIIILSNLSEPLLLSPFFVLIAASGFYSMIKFHYNVLHKPYII
jgi:hypothetical protein